MASRLLVDSDVLIKLAHWGLLDQLASSFDLDRSQVSALASLQFRALRRDGKLFHTPAAADALAGYLSDTSEIPGGRPEDLSRLQGITNLDAGEIELVAACLADPDALLISGDKRAVIALAELGPADVANRLEGRVICLEQLLRMIAGRSGSACVIEGVRVRRELDAALRSVVGPQGCTDAHFLEGMASYVSDLRRQTASLLHPG